MHILFIGYGKTSQRVAKHLFEQGHHISTISHNRALLFAQVVFMVVQLCD
ncbi:hypothetical protein F896_00192 [Acinetobacter genomosp. 15BJ]|uniref:Pyrroline-5-carboxylate reductase catalytic N-terminal domain-containing protein n=1 Tax=Acinetobacter genomosp. 15BJ TaxID=106651 RepID=R9B6N0_9GAMM|nr:hypothetical protein F896_00192 [Acinetobacter genomosp. 15BJ]